MNNITRVVLTHVLLSFCAAFLGILIWPGGAESGPAWLFPIMWWNFVILIIEVAVGCTYAIWSKLDI